MNVFDQYGIREVADVTLYSIHKKPDGSGDVYYVPALYLDTLKVTTLEKNAENVWAQGGIGNSRLISWDHSKTINLSMEDALCSPASLGLCWGGVLSADVKNGKATVTNGLQTLVSTDEKVSRMEKAFYPRNDGDNGTVSHLVPSLKQDWKNNKLIKSAILDGMDIHGFGLVGDQTYKWKLQIDSAAKAVAFVPDRFFSIYGKSYPIKQNTVIGINQSTDAFEYEIIYKRDYKSEKAQVVYENNDIYHRLDEQSLSTITNDSDKSLYELKKLEQLDSTGELYAYNFLKIRKCHDGSIQTFISRLMDNVGEKTSTPRWDSQDTVTILENLGGEPGVSDVGHAWQVMTIINTDQFKNNDLWVSFNGLNALSYYLLTRYEKDIASISPKNIELDKDWTINDILDILLGPSTGETYSDGVTIKRDKTLAVYRYSDDDNKNKKKFRELVNNKFNTNLTFSWPVNASDDNAKITHGKLDIDTISYNGDYISTKRFTFTNTPLSDKIQYHGYDYDLGGQRTKLKKISTSISDWKNIIKGAITKQIYPDYSMYSLKQGGFINYTNAEALICCEPEDNLTGVTISYLRTPITGYTEKTHKDKLCYLYNYKNSHGLEIFVDKYIVKLYDIYATTLGNVTSYSIEERIDAYPDEKLPQIEVHSGQLTEELRNWRPKSEPDEDGTFVITDELKHGSTYGDTGGAGNASPTYITATITNTMYIEYSHVTREQDTTKTLLYQVKDPDGPKPEKVYGPIKINEEAFNPFDREEITGDETPSKQQINDLLSESERKGKTELQEQALAKQILKNQIYNNWYYSFIYNLLLDYLNKKFTYRVDKTYTSSGLEYSNTIDKKDGLAMLHAIHKNPADAYEATNKLAYNTWYNMKTAIIEKIVPPNGDDSQVTSGKKLFLYSKTTNGEKHYYAKNVSTKTYSESGVSNELEHLKDFLLYDIANYCDTMDDELNYNNSGIKSILDNIFEAVAFKFTPEGTIYYSINLIKYAKQFEAIKDTYFNYKDANNTEQIDTYYPRFRDAQSFMVSLTRLLMRLALPKNTLGVAYKCGIPYTLTLPEEINYKNNVPYGKDDFYSHSLWAYVNPRTMIPYDDDYWFKLGEPYYKKSITLGTKTNPLKTQKILIEAGTFPGMYKIVGETYIRSRDTGEDQRMQITLPLCKVKSNLSISLSAESEPTTFNFEVEVATPENGIPMELTFYLVEKGKENPYPDTVILTDGSTNVSII